jgi:hypothetical protein
LVKSVTGAWNQGEVTRFHYQSQDETIYALVEAGAAPVTTGGKPSTEPAVLDVAGEVTLKLWLKGGVWELERGPHALRFYCDTPGVRFELRPPWEAEIYACSSTEATLLSPAPERYPAGVAWLEWRRSEREE